jgi:hypothetical protein
MISQPLARTARSTVLALAATFVFAGVHPSSANAAPTPIPGGANQINGVTGTLKSTIFNGKLRFKKFVLRTATAAEGTADPGGMALTLTYIVSNGVSKQIYGNTSATMADADGVTVAGHSVGVYGAYYTLQPGAAARGTICFSLPAGFVPVKILITPGDGTALRINLKSSDLPTPAASAAASPTASP